MKPYLYILMLSMTCHAAEVTLAWDANTEPEVALYELRVRTATSTNEYVVMGRTNTQQTLSLTGTNLLDIRAVTTNQVRSEWSAPLRGVVPATPTLRIIVPVQSSAKLEGPYDRTEHEITLLAADTSRFYRLGPMQISREGHEGTK